MTIIDAIATRFGYTKAQVSAPPDWLRATAEYERYSIPERTLPEAQLELYQRLSWVQMAISAVASLGATTVFSVKELSGEDENDIPNHPFELLLDRPNPLDSRFDLLETTITDYSLTGNAYWWLNKANEKAAPAELWPMPVPNVVPVPDGRLYLRGYLYDPGWGQPIPLEPWEVVHFKRYHPRNRFVGLSPIEALATDAAAELNRQQYDANYFDKGFAKPQGAIAFSDPVDDVSWAKIKADVEESYGGNKRKMMMLRNAGKGGVQWMQMAMAQRDMQFLEARTFTKEEIFALFAPGLASMLAINATEANSTSGRATFTELAVWPHLVRMAEKITNDLLPVYGPNLRGEFDDIRVTDRAMALQEQQAFERVATIDEVRNKYYNIDPLGDDRGTLLVLEVGKGLTRTSEPPPPVIMQPGAHTDPNAPPATPAPDTGAPPKPNDGASNDQANTQKALKSASVKAHTSAMVAFFMPPAVVSEIVKIQGYLPIASSPVPAGELHMTLLMLGEAALMIEQKATVERVLRTFAASNSALMGRMNGIGRFHGVEDGSVDALYISFDAKALPEWRQGLVNALREAGIETPSDHSFIPHITLGYVPTDAPTPWVYLPQDEITLDAIWLAWGDTRQNFILSPNDQAAQQAEAKALRKWLKKRPKADPAQFDNQHLSDDEVKAIVSEIRGGVATEQNFFTLTGKATRKLPGEDGNDRKRGQLERYHADKLSAVFRRLVKQVAPVGTTVENITPDIAVQRFRDNMQPLRDAVNAMLLDGAHLGADTGIAQVETILGTRKATIVGSNWDLVNEDVVQWVLGEGTGIGHGYGDSITQALAQTSEATIRTHIAAWIRNEQNWTTLVEDLGRSVFSEQRAITISTTELTRAYAEGNRAAWRSSGIIQEMRWQTSNDELVCPVCGPLAQTIAPVDGSFAGDLMPPAHPNCRCWVTAVSPGLEGL